MSTALGKKTKSLLAEKILKHRQEIQEWSKKHAENAPPPFYCSVDLRDAGYKIVPVDSNLYPAGFNNICPEDMRAAPRVLRNEVLREVTRLGIQEPRKTLLIPEAHTQNKFYLENVYYLLKLLSDAGFETALGWYGPTPDGTSDPIQLKTATEKDLIAHPISITDGTLSSNGFVPDFILLNNDFSSGYPKIFDPVRQPILPSHALGWHTRKKSSHFKHYNALAKEFSEMIDVDPWLIQIETEEIKDVGFNDEKGIEETAQVVEKILQKTKSEYESRKIKRDPFVFVKNNSGTYGMGIMMVHSADELRHMNRRAKNKMSIGKNRLPITSLAIQEGIPTSTLVDRLPAEPVIYLLGDQLIGGFLRANQERGDEDNLNAPGMMFRKLCMSDLHTSPDELDDEGPRDVPILELVYGSIALISALATGEELAEATRMRMEKN